MSDDLTTLADLIGKDMAILKRDMSILCGNQTDLLEEIRELKRQPHIRKLIEEKEEEKSQLSLTGPEPKLQERTYISRLAVLKPLGVLVEQQSFEDRIHQCEKEGYDISEIVQSLKSKLESGKIKSNPTAYCMTILEKEYLS